MTNRNGRAAAYKQPSILSAGRGRSISQILTGRCRCYAKMSPGSIGASPRTVQYKQLRLDPWGRRQPG
ncbi:Dual specificity protein [Trichinella spiralis]|uniref:Dual specificity protein n=2 Tax=Trichinella spiralis TaxID=6334 RepID=A0ABR3KW58_TRISP|nr:hypothetical protein T01_10083 [Trichinella spiralis]